MVGKNPPANAGARVRSWFRRMPHAVEELILCTSTPEPVLLGLGAVTRARASQACTLQRSSCQRRKQGKPVGNHEDPAQPNLNNFLKRIHLLKKKKRSSTPMMSVYQLIRITLDP